MRTCQVCGQENPEIASFCLACGNPLGEEPPAGREERRVVTVLFVDLEGFTPRAEALDPEDVRTILNAYYERVREEIERFGGSVEKFIGDAVMAVFGAPVAFGDDPERAVRAALAVREALRSMNEDDPELDLRARLAVNTGEAIVALGSQPGHGEAMVAGDVVNTAARLQTAAPVGGVLVGEETYAATRTAIDYEQTGAVTVKGKAQPLRVWLARSEATPAGARALSGVPMVGRESELDVLRGIWGRTAEERRSHLVTVFGPPGIGKSRLTLEFGDIVSELGGRTLWGRSAPYGTSSPYAAFAQHVKQVAGIFDTDQLADASAKLKAAVADLVGDAADEETVTHLALLTGLQTEREAGARESLFDAARLLVESLASRQPTLLVFEDLHWADDSLLDLLEDLAARTHGVPVLLLALARPDLLTARPSWGGGLPAYTALPLEPLAETDAAELAARLLEQYAAADPVDLASALVDRAEGNPLFIEEFAASLGEGRASAETLPTSIRSIIASRLDSLPDAERSLLLDASVVGRVFWRGALEHIRGGDGVTETLASLERRDFIRREPISRLQGDRQFRFKHALIREIAYQRLVRPVRRARHEAVAQFLEQATAETAASAEAVAHHWREAGEPARALDQLVAAADQAGRGWAKGRSVALYREALELVPEDDEERQRDLRGRLAVALMAEFHIQDAERLRRR